MCGVARADLVGSPVPALSNSMGLSTDTERRQLTVVFCDLVGSTELSTAIDPEEFSELIQLYQQSAVSIAQRFAGDVEGYSGDGILFRFGWPEAHDDDPEQALRAALEIVSTMGELDDQRRLRVRAGVHTGLVVVGQMGADERRATMAVGETVNVAARLQVVGEPGTVVATASTVALVEGLFDVKSLGDLRLKGVTEPVEAFCVLRPSGRRSRLKTTHGRFTPFIGRALELDVLVDRWRAAASGNGGAVLVSGEPGVGKSRLVYELRGRVSDQPHRWLDCACSSYTAMTVLWPFVQLIEQELQLEAEIDPTLRLDRLEHGLTSSGLHDREAVELVASMMGVPGGPVSSLSPERRLERTIEVLAAWALALSRDQTLLLVVEDLHWCDPTSLDALARLMDQIADRPLLLVMTARREFANPWTERQTPTRLRIDPFDDDQVRDLVSTLGGERTLPDPVVERIVSSAAGIPLYAEEVGRAVLESGILSAASRAWELTAPLGDLEIPQTLQGSLLARLDRLGTAKAVAQVAAVIGRTFPFDLVAAVSGIDVDLLTELLDRLVESDLVFETGTPPQTDYVFKHVLVQEIAYESLLRRTRRRVHGHIARLLEERIDTSVNTAPEVVARHYEAAGSIERAAELYQLAAARAAAGSAHREAMAFLRQGISLVERLPADARSREMEVEMQLSLGSAIIAARSYSDPAIESAYARARELCEHLGNDARVGLALAGLSIFYTNRGETALGAELAERVLAIAGENDDDTLELLGRVQLALPRIFQGRESEALEHTARALDLYDPVRHRGVAERFGTDHGVAAHVFAGWASLVQGYLDRGLAHMSAAVDLAEHLDQPFNLAYALAFKTTCHWERGESAETLREAGRARQICEEQGFDFWLGVSRVWEETERIVATRDRSDLAKVLEASLIAGEAGNRGGSTCLMARVAEAARAAGDFETAWEVAGLALAVSADTDQPWWDSSLHRMRAELLFDLPDAAAGSGLGPQDTCWQRAEGEWIEALSLARRYGYPVHGLRAAAGYASLLEHLGRSEEAYRELQRWYGRCPEGLGTPVLAAARKVLDDLVADGAGRHWSDPIN
jgi:class 3 adenylate cyclase/tetratricopeptide (TPR) repeat protein